jgi:hypothetical protein
MNNNSYNYNNMDMHIMPNMMLTFSWLNLIDMSLFTMCVVVCIQTADIQKDQVPVLCSDVSCVGLNCIQHLPVQDTWC